MDYGLFAHPHGNPFWNTSLPNQPSSSGATKSLANGNEQSPANTVSYSSSDHLSSMEGPPMTVYYPQYPFPQSQPNNHSNQSMANTCNDHDLMLRSMSCSPGEKTNDGLFSRHPTTSRTAGNGLRSFNGHSTSASSSSTSTSVTTRAVLLRSQTSVAIHSESVFHITSHSSHSKNAINSRFGSQHAKQIASIAYQRRSGSLIVPYANAHWTILRF